MLKTFGIFIIVLSCTALGFLSSDKLKTRIESLNSIYSSLLFIENEVSYGKNDIISTLSALGQAKNITWLSDIIIKADSKSIIDCLYEAISQSKFSLLQSDKEIIKNFLYDFGNLDTISQLKSIAHAKRQITSAKEDALENYNKLGKLYRSMGVLCGLLFTILLF